MTREILMGMNRTQKKELFGALATSLFNDFSKTEKNEFLQKILAEDKTNLQVIDMVEY